MMLSKLIPPRLMAWLVVLMVFAVPIVAQQFTPCFQRCYDRAMVIYSFLGEDEASRFFDGCIAADCGWP